ncbi:MULTISPECIES: LysR family transcriptional regulator [Bradyrhizobium]|jgi:DNA-binding transcriptional LysR family regulator|uniref:LysR family transcriptional regulator n=1 Tax=Bradyrhizobium TaxID=374 RepID=UPI000487AF13|nr:MULTISPECIES: LysR family transcriptional regulator [Bradyrhizobium]MCS3452885.1 DNA-binding transcriptional LysR family regulator [Bradyrhizobium elkanii]MCS3565011.1 DNA-binding transcriptional LysR family regulator [Bradyrhizobium elkanii]MCW2145161.1 DNA-binding transcriptional LysR family regulator [Bradyrhizobium elkanii]MCW2356022.1 DNA-binding transcriptional LysR family regulator [Bradyrhizobium elkanii]MCW2377987.1 DNA-binding transcriptional LysR family regulator [Bradyrhizobium 
MKQNFTVRQGALDGVEAFLAVAQHRSFRRAAAELGVTPSAISQAVRALEARLGAVLFIRTTRSVGLTDAGERFLARARPAFEELVAASGAARELGQKPAGLLRLTVPRSVVPILLEPLIASFCKAYPEIEVELAASEELVDLAAGGFDAGIRMGQFINPDMVAVRLTKPFPFAIVGSPDYLARRGRPKRPDDLRRHACLRLRRSNGGLAPWSLNDNGRSIELAVSGSFIGHDFPTLVGAAVEGVGLAQVPAPLVSGAVKEKKLVRVLDAFAPTTPGVFLYYPGHRQIMPKLRAFIDHVKSRPRAGR